MMMKRIVLAVAVSLVPLAASAQQQVDLHVTIPEAQAVLNAMAAQPWRDVNPLMQKLIGQINAQTAPPSKPAPLPSAKPGKAAKPQIAPTEAAPQEKAPKKDDEE